MGDSDAVVELAVDGQREQTILKADLLCVSEALIEGEECAALIVRRLPVHGRGDDQGYAAENDYEAHPHGGSYPGAPHSPDLKHGRPRGRAGRPRPGLPHASGSSAALVECTHA